MGIWSIDKLEFEEIRDSVQTYALSYVGKQHIANMLPSTALEEVRRRLAETEEAKRLVESGGSVPIPTLDGVEALLHALGKGFLLTETPLSSLRQCLESTLQLQQYLRRKESIAPTLCKYGEALYPLDELAQAIRSAIHLGFIRDDASRELLSIRKRILIVGERMRKKIEGLLSKYAAYLQDTVVTERSGRWVLAVKRAEKRHVKGALIDESASGQTVFIEPTELSSLMEERFGLELAEEQEKQRILATLTALVEQNRWALERNVETVGVCDFVLAKAKYARHIGGIAPEVTDRGRTRLIDARHPLLGREAVPLQFAIGENYRGLILTGPNTGGKTVTLKTVGLLSLMVQCGLLVPVHANSVFPIYEQILVDIGDGQSLAQSLSTFSAHIRAISEIIEHASHKTLVLLDEMASGTDPGEGISLSIAVLEYLYAKGATIVATTHFNEIKVFASETSGFENARMEFDVDTLAPRYQLKIGEAGESYALLIAQKYGLCATVIARSMELMKAGRGRGDWADMASLQVIHEVRVDEEAKPIVTNPRLEDTVSTAPAKRPYQVGDRVWIHRLGKSGILYSLPDGRGNVTVVIQKQKHTLNVKRMARRHVQGTFIEE